MQTLKDLGLDKNTLVIFTSDNGPLKGFKRDLYEGGIRVPMIANWPGTIAASTTSDHISAFQDLFPTLAELAAIEAPKNTDGVSFLPTLLGKEEEQKKEKEKRR